MQILAISDPHELAWVKDAIPKKAELADLIIVAGDLTWFGEGMDKMIAFLDSLNKPVLLIHGNHELEEDLRNECEKSNNLVFIHGEAVEIDDLVLIAHGGGGFSMRCKDFEEKAEVFQEAIRNHVKSIAVFHAPPHNTELDKIDEDYHVGSKSYKEFIEKAQPNIAIVGHIHETFGKEEMIGKTRVINPGPEGLLFEL